MLGFLEADRWDENDRDLIAWPGNPAYRYALDLHSWGYLIFEDFPESTLISADRYLNTQTTTATETEISGYCFDEDRDVVWLEGTGQMTLAFGVAGMDAEKALYLAEMEKNLMSSALHPEAVGFPYASNPGTTYGGDQLWDAADDQIAISGGAWYLFATQNFNPFAVGYVKNAPVEDRFWID